MSAAGDSACARRANGEFPSLFAKGYVDNILFDETAVAEAVAYVKDNPRRRSYFAYSRDARGQLLKDEPPAVATRDFEEKRDGFLEAAEHGAVLLSPCISEGERHIARLAFERGLRVITLSNKGFAPLYKPGGKLFDQTAKGNLLMLAPINWPYIPGEKKMTRIDACILNRIAQWLAGEGAVEIKYRGVEPAHIDRLAAAAIERKETRNG